MVSDTPWQTLITKYPLLDIKSKEPHQPVGDGWLSILDTAFNSMSLLVKAGHLKGVSVAQIKEKFGSLRLYANPLFNMGTLKDSVFDAFQNICRDAETASNHTCEECGQPGVLRTGEWLKTLCDDHWEQLEAQRAMKEAAWKRTPTT